MSDLNYLYGKPLSKADFKISAEDFMVDEELGIEFTGSGEHVCLQVVKKGENTQADFQPWLQVHLKPSRSAQLRH